MKILFLTQIETIEGRRLLEIKTLMAEGHAVRVVAWNTSGDERPGALPITYIHNQSRVSFHRSLKKSLLVTAARIVFRLYPRTLREVLHSPWDVLHCCHVSLLPLGVLGKMLKGGRLVYDSYEFHALNLSARLNHPLLARLAALVIETAERFCLPWVDAVLTVPSRENREERKFSRRCPQVTVLMNVPSLDGFRLKTKSFLPPPSAIYVGGVMVEKGLYIMLEAVAKVVLAFPDFKLHLVGRLKENREEVDEAITRLNLSNHIVIHDWAPPERLPAYLSLAWMGLAPYQPNECYNLITIGNSRKIFEYMQFGLPVVAPSFGEVARVVAEEKAGLLVDTTDPEAIASAILHIIENESLREEMAKNGLSAIARTYNWEKEAGKLITSYRCLENSLGNQPGMRSPQ